MLVLRLLYLKFANYLLPGAYTLTSENTTCETYFS